MVDLNIVAFSVQFLMVLPSLRFWHLEKGWRQAIFQIVLHNKQIYFIRFAKWLHIGFEKHQKWISKYRIIDIDYNIDQY